MKYALVYTYNDQLKFREFASRWRLSWFLFWNPEAAAAVNAGRYQLFELGPTQGLPN